MSANLERMGDLAHHIAKDCTDALPSNCCTTRVGSYHQEMGNIAERIIAKTTSVIESHDLESALQLEKDDDEMDKLHRKLFLTLLDDRLAARDRNCNRYDLAWSVLRTLRRSRSFSGSSCLLLGYRRIRVRTGLTFSLISHGIYCCLGCSWVEILSTLFQRLQLII